MKVERTPTQKAALRDAYKLLIAQFDDVLLVCSVRADLDTLATDLDVCWKGNWLVVNVLAEFDAGSGLPASAATTPKAGCQDSGPPRQSLL